ncbi:MAG: hypothetical protein IPG45_12075 [Deltaproteobacteria bacterium]|nr:hypothetical protein [Deltaproteobacteria bacterium]
MNLDEQPVEQLITRLGELRALGNSYGLSALPPPPELATEYAALEAELKRRQARPS